MTIINFWYFFYTVKAKFKPIFKKFILEPGLKLELLLYLIFYLKFKTNVSTN